MSDDLVYLDDPDVREECVLRDHGVIYRGSHKKMTTKPWNYGQVREGSQFIQGEYIVLLFSVCFGWMLPFCLQKGPPDVAISSLKKRHYSDCDGPGQELLNRQRKIHSLYIHAF